MVEDDCVEGGACTARDDCMVEDDCLSGNDCIAEAIDW